MNKACKPYAVDLSAYFDGELAGEERQAMEAHLADCEGCRDTLARFRKMRTALHELARPPRKRQSILADLKARLAEEEPAFAQDKPLIS
jgi:anti-sigma factor RsiW